MSSFEIIYFDYQYFTSLTDTQNTIKTHNSCANPVQIISYLWSNEYEYSCFFGHSPCQEGWFFSRGAALGTQ
jgi:hypothetical protein